MGRIKLEYLHLFDGEGNMRRVAIYSAYALVPFIIGNFLSTAISYGLTLDESIWYTAIYQVGLWWSVILMVFGMKACHQYNFTMTLFQQVYVFFATIYTEILYRVRS